jgi:hypothetical protein
VPTEGRVGNSLQICQPRSEFARGFGNLIGNLIPYSRAGKQLRNAFHIAIPNSGNGNLPLQYHPQINLPMTWVELGRIGLGRFEMS